MQAIKACTDRLAAMGKPMDNKDIMDKILQGLDYEAYKPIIDSVNARDTVISFEELYDKLITREIVADKQLGMSSMLPATAMAMHCKAPHVHHNKQGWSAPNASNGLLPKPRQNTSNRTPKTFLGKCQWCRASGHALNQCSVFKAANPSIEVPDPFQARSILHGHSPVGPQAHMATTNSPYNGGWLLDSGASHHVTNDLNNLSLHAPYDGTEELIIGDGSSLPISNTGSFSLSTPSHTFKFSNVLHVPNISRNILSISQFCQENNTSIEFLPFLFLVKERSRGTTILQGPTKAGVYEWNPGPPRVFTSLKLPTHDWHHRLGHPSNSVLKLLSTRFSLSITDFHMSMCNSCNINKSHKLPFSSSTLTSSAPLELIFSDVWTSPVHSHDNYKYYIIFVDHFTRYTWLYPLKKKSDSLETFIRFRGIVEKYFRRQIIQVFSDNGGEYDKLHPYLVSNGISHLTSPPHTPEHNGFAERRHKHIVETALALLSHAHLPLEYWTHAVATATYLINRMPTPTLNNYSPYFRLFGTPPNYHKLRNFGSLCYPWLRPYATYKLDNRSLPCIFIGYSPSQSA